jgi:ectoine hydroxylase-related dioxygenase (phytanoyl-CoA dioxygenase family)
MLYFAKTSPISSIKMTTMKNQLTEAEIETYFREGYILKRNLIPMGAILAVREIAETTKTTDGGGWTPRVFDYENPTQDAELHALLKHPSVVGAAGQLLGTPPLIYYGMLAIVPAHGGNGLPWHQDNMYSHIYGGALNIFIALSEITPDMANLWVVPGSHKLGTQASQQNETTAKGHREALVEPEGAMILPTLQPGDACLFTRDTLHRSLTNTTDKNRYAYAAQYCATHARYTSDGKVPFRALAP